MATTPNNVVSVNNSSINNTAAVPESTESYTATIKGVSGDGTKDALKESDGIFFTLDIDIIQLDDNGAEKKVQSFSKTPKCAFQSFASLDAISLLYSAVEENPHKFEGYLPTFIHFVKGAKIQFTRRLAEKDELVNNVPINKRGYITEHIKVLNVDDMNTAFWTAKGQMMYDRLLRSVKKTNAAKAAIKFEY